MSTHKLHSLIISKQWCTVFKVAKPSWIGKIDRNIPESPDNVINENRSRKSFLESNKNSDIFGNFLQNRNAVMGSKRDKSLKILLRILFRSGDSCEFKASTSYVTALTILWISMFKWCICSAQFWCCITRARAQEKCF